VCCTGLTGLEMFCGSRQDSPAGTSLTGGAHRPDRCRSVRLESCVLLRSRVCEVGCWFLGPVGLSGCVLLANLVSESETCDGSRVHLVGAFISFEKNFYWLPFTPPSLVRRIGPSAKHAFAAHMRLGNQVYNICVCMVFFLYKCV
jgi:hypothetical protein